MATGGLPHFPPFDVESDRTTVGPRWTKWILKLETYMAAFNITNGDRMKAMLLHFAGDEVFDIASTLTITPRAADPTNNTPAESSYEATKRTLNEYFCPTNNREFNIYLFRQSKQANDESIDQFYSRLKKMSLGCDFANVEGEIKSQVIQGCKSGKLRLSALQDPTLTLSRILEKERTQELTKLQAESIEQRAPPPSEAATNHIKTHHKKNWHKSGQTRGGSNPSREFKNKFKRKDRKQCLFCGGDFHEDINSCPARGKKCNFCGNLNHFANHCIKKQYRQKRQQQNNKASTNSMATKSQDEKSSDESSDGEGLAYSIYSMKQRGQPGLPRIAIKVNGEKVIFILDSGSTATIIDRETYKLIGEPSLRRTSMKIYAYKAEKPVELMGELEATLTAGNKNRSTIEKIYVTADGDQEGILSYKAAVRLKLIRLDAEVQTINKIEELKPKPIGKIRGVQVKLHIDPDIKPVALPHRRIPYHLREKVEEEIKRLEELEIIEKVSGPTPWVSPVVIVPKPNGNIRLCVDMRQPNRAIQRERHVIPTLEDILAEVNGSRIFSVIDLNQAYHQMELEEKSRYITTFSTHIGLRRYKRLFFGLTSASEVFHNTLREILSDIEGAFNSSDDILIHGRNQAEHDDRLKKVRKRLEEWNVTINEAKEQVSKSSVIFHGVILSSDGLKVDPAKVKTITEFPTPSTPTEVRSFLGMVNYCSRFIKNHADLTAPLRKLTLKENDFSWTEECEQAFIKLKKCLASTKNLKFFNPKIKTELVVDASPIGLGAILCQIEKDNKPVVVAYASKALSPTEQRYSQTEREALAIIWGCEQFAVYLRGASFVVWTDHKALVPLFNNPSSNLSTRMERWMLRKQAFDMTVQYLPGAWNAADYLSRHPERETAMKISKQAKVAEQYVNMVIKGAKAALIVPEEIRIETRNDVELQFVSQALENGKWYQAPEEIQNTYGKIHHELSTSTGGIVMRGNRICLPKSLQARVVKLAHEGHQGMTKTKKLLRSYVWFPKMDRMVDEAVKRCMPCQVSTKSKLRAPLQMTELPDHPWQTVSIDFYTLPSGEELMVVSDDYSRYPAVEIVAGTAFQQVEKKLQHIFAIFGVPETIKSDNGPPFNGNDFKEFSQQFGFKHRKVTPVWPEANGEVERFMKTIGKFMRTTKAEQKSWRKELEGFLTIYRTTPHIATERSPAEILFGRRNRNRMPDLKQSDEAYKNKLKEYADKKRRVREHNLKNGDLVYRKKEKGLLNKTEPYYKTEPYKVTDVKGTMVTVERSGQTVTRNCSFFKKKEEEVLWWSEGEMEIDEEENQQVPEADDPADVPALEPAADEPAEVPAEERQAVADPVLGRGKRVRFAPKRLESFEVRVPKKRKRK